MHFLFLFTLLGLGVAARQDSSYHVVHEKRTVTGGTLWKRVPQPVQVDTIIPLHIALTQQNLQLAEADLLSVSDPASPAFGRHWHPAKVAARFAPSSDSVAAVSQWLRDAGVDPKRIQPSHSGGWLLVHNATVEEAQRLLKTTYHLYRRDGDDEEKLHLGCEEYKVPVSIRHHVDLVMPTVHVGADDTRRRRRRRYKVVRARAKPPPPPPPLRTVPSPGHPRKPLFTKRTSHNLTSCHSLITPDCLRAMYHIPPPPPRQLNSTAGHPNVKNTFALYEPTWSSWLPSDLDTFFSLFAPSLVGHRPLLKQINGGIWQDAVQAMVFNLEPDLDFEYAMTLTSPAVPIVNFQVGLLSGTSLFSPLLAAFDRLYCHTLLLSNNSSSVNVTEAELPDCGNTPPPAVLSISHSNNEMFLSEPYLRRQCFEFLKLGLMGTSVVVASGDCGPAGQSCECRDLDPGEEGKGRGFAPTWPAGCPYVTAVGGTQFPTPPPPSESRNASFLGGDMDMDMRGGGHTEVAFRHISSSRTSTSGGGFSNIFAAPTWQVSAAQKYLVGQGDYARNMSAFKLFDKKGRGVPDVAAAASGFAAVVNGKWTTIYGTSASAPVFASILALVNEARLKRGKSAVGFVNPVLYANPKVMRDVVTGGNHGCGREAFRASEGWDPVTGLGTPDYERLVKLYLSLP